MAKKLIKHETQVSLMKRADFDALPHRPWNEHTECDSIVILPLKKMHESGYRLMDFVAVVGEKAICRMSGCSDVIHLDGIGGRGHDWWKSGGVPRLVPPSGWNIDCLPKSGLLRLFTHKKLLATDALSSFEVYVLHGEK